MKNKKNTVTNKHKNDKPSNFIPANRYGAKKKKK